MKKGDVRRQVAAAIGACQAKKAADVTVLQMSPTGGDGFTDYFVICSGSNPRQIQAISDEVEQKLSTAGLRPTHVEGYQRAEWILLDYVDFVVHIFQEKARKFYDLERLWKSAKRLTLSELASAKASVKSKTSKKKAAQPAGRSSRARPAGSKSKAKSTSPRKSRGTAASRRSRRS